MLHATGYNKALSSHSTTSRNFIVHTSSVESSVSTSSRRVSRDGNVSGQFWVDSTCIDCDLCRRMSPSFTRAGDGSVVSKQPSSKEQRIDALQALLSCPTSSIHAEKADKAELKFAQRGLPKLVPGCSHIYHCG
ncbi:hypothetical protein CEUSTIGMA_g10389.t1 [Chlamydomonas eustigma]|uniref:Uncharacterized protein n=1 Tax=Chlamydomonas eustigma TaxID=1157962 RepID=A0A250XJ71_9CHLO|nr:hypothetical protein CEUSTIGMA_g10389.t1 [Chlamydomonas eustigma]|eukprot:GAX82962.1 hypothetical protein CEUSTIGMA_g10389.t1 [Chlamydomonas eustigma]